MDFKNLKFFFFLNKSIIYSIRWIWVNAVSKIKFLFTTKILRVEIFEVRIVEGRFIIFRVGLINLFKQHILNNLAIFPFSNSFPCFFRCDISFFICLNFQLFLFLALLLFIFVSLGWVLIFLQMLHLIVIYNTLKIL